MTAAAALIQNAIKSSRVVIFSKTYCPYCTNAKRLFDSLGEKYELYELDNMDNGAEVQSELQRMTSQRTVPSIFIHGQHVGGFDRTSELHHSGQLQKLLARNEEH